MAGLITRLIMLTLTFCSVMVLASAKHKAALPKSLSDSVIHKAIVQVLGSPNEMGGNAKNARLGSDHWVWRYERLSASGLPKRRATVQVAVED